VAAFLEAHLADMRAITPPESKHALDLDALRRPEVTFWTARDGGRVVGTGALQRLDATHGEVKSMRTAPERRRSGIAALLLQTIIDEARDAGLTRLSLETGSAPPFAPARALYESFGFTGCEPFAGYRPDPNSTFLTLALRP